jgi:hypothetical protein
VFESHRRRFLPFLSRCEGSEFFLKRQKCRAEDGASFELFFIFFEQVVVEIWWLEVEGFRIGS